MNTITKIAKKVLLFGAVISLGFATYSASAAVEPYPQTSGSLISRVGSLVLAPTVSSVTLASSYVNSFGRCEKIGNTDSATRTCLDVQGTGSFSNLVANNLRTFLLDKTFIGPSDGVGPGVQTVPLFVADTPADNDSIMVSDLGRFNVGGQFEPADATTMRGVCANADGEFYSCPVPDAPISTCPLTYTDQDNGIIYPIVDVDGACWFGRDLERNQLTLTQANYLFDFATDIDAYDNQIALRRAGSGISNVRAVEVSGATNYMPYAGEHSGDSYFTMSTGFRNFLMNTCGWTAASMTEDSWYYVEIPRASTPSGGNRSPIYDIICIGDDSSSDYHRFVYGVNEPAHDLLTAATPGVFFHVEDISDNTCPAGWHVPLHSEWLGLETALNTRSADEGTSFAGSTLATEMDITATLSPATSAANPAWAYSGSKYNGSRYHSREAYVDTDRLPGDHDAYYSATVSGVYSSTVFHDSFTLFSSSNVLSFSHLLVDWDKSSTGYYNYTYWLTSLFPSSATSRFTRLIERLVPRVHAAAADIFDRTTQLGKVRCIQGQVDATWVIGGWGSCTNQGTGVSPNWRQSRSVVCQIDGESHYGGNCSGTVPAASRSCAPSGTGSGSGFRR